MRTERDNVLKSAYLARSRCAPTRRCYYCSISLRSLVLLPDAISSALTLWVELSLQLAETGVGGMGCLTASVLPARTFLP